MSTLSDGAITVTFTDDLQWVDEFAWAPVEQNVERTITGALVVQNAARAAGRPITLAPDSESAAWMTRASLDTLRTWAATAGQVLTLGHRGVNRSVIWRHQDTAIDATPVVPFADVQAGDFYRVTLRFMEI